MTRTEELFVLALLAVLTLVGAVLWAREGVMLWLGTSILLCL